MIQRIKKTPAFYGAAWALGAGALIHLFGLVNVLHNHDNIWQQTSGYGAGVELGRWMLSLMGDAMEKLGFGYNLPQVNGLLYLAMLACAAGLAVSFLRVRGKASAAMIGILFVVFPSVTAVLFYKFTTFYYGIAVFLAVLAAWLLFTGNRWRILLSALCVACSMGIYQAYAPLTISLVVLRLLKDTLTREEPVSGEIRQGLRACAALILGVVLYFAGLKAALILYHAQLSTYQGVDQMGQISLGELPALLVQTYRAVFLLPLEDYGRIAGTPLLRLLYGFLELLSLGMLAVLAAARRKDRLRLLVIAGLLLAVPLALNFVMVMCSGSEIHTLMVYALVFLPSIPLIFLEEFLDAAARWRGIGTLCRKAALVLAGAMIVCYAYGANAHYVAMYYANRQVENYCAALVAQVRMTPGFDTDKQWAMIGRISDPLLQSDWRDAMYYGGHCFTNDLLNQYSRMSWFENYIGYEIPLVSDQEAQELAGTEAVKQMPCWPDYGSIQVIGDTVVVKFSETEQS